MRGFLLLLGLMFGCLVVACVIGDAIVCSDRRRALLRGDCLRCCGETLVPADPHCWVRCPECGGTGRPTTSEEGAE